MFYSSINKHFRKPRMPWLYLDKTFFLTLGNLKIRIYQNILDIVEFSDSTIEQS
ncbi:unnamed protein product [Larinioides sclopetarius]|uniref:Uncharacterized protein n=1 Tax=Larinioides sclopetarius TaxID=280406 RepID=A0AAV1YQS3_9ARAC